MMLDLQPRTLRNSDDTLARVLEQKRAVDEMLDKGSAAARDSHNRKYAAIFDAIIASHGDGAPSAKS